MTTCWRMPLEQRFTYDPKQNLVLRQFRAPVRCAAATTSTPSRKPSKPSSRRSGKRVYAIVNYDNFSIVPELLDEYSAMVRGLMDHYYSGVSRYTTSGFLRMKLGECA